MNVSLITASDDEMEISGIYFLLASEGVTCE
jgi:hypothetical protein